MARIVILGAGMMGTAFAWPLADRGHTVRLVGSPLDDDIIQRLRATGEHPKLRLRVPETLGFYVAGELANAMDGADAIALGVSSAGVRWAARALAPLLAQAMPLCMVSKGLSWDGQELRVLPDVFLEELPSQVRATLFPVGVAGPCIAGELARRVPTAVVFTSRHRASVERWAELARAPYYHVFCSTDLVGVEVCAALKNAYAMGVGLASGLHAAAGGESGSIALHNYESAVFAQAIWEMRRLIRVLGAEPDQASWLPGVGDLDVTCNGGRTGRFGHLLGLGIGAEEAVRRMEGATLECLEILRTLRDAVESYTARGRIDPGALPLAEHLAAVALDGAPVDMPFARFFA